MSFCRMFGAANARTAGLRKIEIIGEIYCSILEKKFTGRLGTINGKYVKLLGTKTIFGCLIN